MSAQIIKMMTQGSTLLFHVSNTALWSINGRVFHFALKPSDKLHILIMKFI